MGLMSLMFSNRNKYLDKELKQKNALRAFPANSSLTIGQMTSCEYGDGVLISGGSEEERAACIMALLKKERPYGTLILNGGNRFLRASHLNGLGMKAAVWDEHIYKGMSKAEMLSLLTEGGKDSELAFFFSFALEVAEMLGYPQTLAGLAAIDWLGCGWQQALYMREIESERCMDLLRRYDKEMAKTASRAVCTLESTMRYMGEDTGDGMDLSAGLHKNLILTKEVYGSHGQAVLQCMAAVTKKAEEGKMFTLVLENVYHPEFEVVKDIFPNVKIILSGPDLCECDPGLHLTKRQCSVIAFRQASYQSAEKLSEAFFGSYQKVTNEVSTGKNRSGFSTGKSTTTTIKKEKDYRLQPATLWELPFGAACVHMWDGIEGMVILRKRGEMAC